MSIAFDSLPVTLRLPGTYVEFAAGSRGPLDIDQTLLIIGQKLAAGSAEADEPVLVTHPDQADNLFGKGSVLARMYRTSYANNSYTETWCLPLDDDGAAQAAAGALLFAGTVSKAGSLCLLIGGTRIRVAVAVGDSPAAIATAVTAAIQANADLPVSAAVNGETAEQVDLTAKNKGELGNGIDLRHSYYISEFLPDGLTLTITAMTGGTANPDISTGLAACAGKRFDYFCTPYTDSSNLTDITEELETRWGWQVQTHGHGFTAASGTVATLQALGNTLNSQHLSLMGAGKSPTTPECFAAACAALCAYNLNQDPARPVQTLKVKEVLPPKESDHFTANERDLLLHDGVSTFYLSSDREVVVEALITTYQENVYGAPDTAYLYANTPCTISYVAQSLIAYLTSKFPRHKLADDDGPTPPAGARIATPSLVRAEVISHLENLYTSKGVVESPTLYEDSIVAERDETDRGRVNLLLPVQIIGQLRRTFLRMEHS